MKPRRQSGYGRASANRTPRRRILVVCEGEKTEPTYLRELKVELRLASLDIVGSKSCGSAPICLVDEARERNGGKVGRRNTEYDEVWIVCDVDDHESLARAVDKAQANGFEVALSNPCFEIWLLLHFAYSTRARHRDDVQRELRRDDYLPGYEKGTSCYQAIRALQDDAAGHARRLRDAHAKAGSSPSANPSTRMDLLLRVLQELAET